MREARHRICSLADEAAEASEPLEALQKLRDLRAELDAFERSRVLDALRGNASFGAIATALGISRQAAHRRYRDLAPKAPERVALSSRARRIVQLAREEAASAGARGVASEHLLLAVLRGGGSPAAAIEAGGVTADALRACVRSDSPPRRPDDAREVLAGAAEIATARRSRYVEPEHIALAAINARGGGALEAVIAAGARPEPVRERLAC